MTHSDIKTSVTTGLFLCFFVITVLFSCADSSPNQKSDEHEEERSYFIVEGIETVTPKYSSYMLYYTRYYKMRHIEREFCGIREEVNKFQIGDTLVLTKK